MRKINTVTFRRATRSTARQINRQILLNLVREHQPVSRADLARRMGIGRGVVTSLIGALITEGALYEGETVEAPRGRKPRMLYVRTRDRLVISIDVRLSRTYVMLNDFAGTQIALETFETILSPAGLASELVRRVQRMLKAHDAAGRCEGIGLVVPGLVDRRTGRVVNAPQLGWRDVDLRGPIAAGIGLPVKIENAPIACALAQMWMGQHGNGNGDFVYMTVSDGVGAAIVVNGEVVRGRDQTAGEFGHIPLHPDGPRCLCGAQGCLEVYTSNLATLSRYLGRELSSASPRAKLQAMPLTMTDLVARALAGDARATAALDETARYLGLGLSMIINTLNPGRIFIGGEITGAWERLEPIVRAVLAERVLTEAAAKTPIIAEAVGGLPRLRGATALVAAPLFAAPQVA
jgi:N-acetylglucosamine repressor